MAIPMRAEVARDTVPQRKGVQAVTVEELVARLDEAVALPGPAKVTARIQRDLETILGSGSLQLDPRFRQTHPDRYARRLLHRNDQLDYTAVVMTWGPGQETPLHDHDGSWCVEGVVEGRIRVTRYQLLEQGINQGSERGLCRFLRRGTLEGGVGEAGSLIPPLEHHVLGNADPERIAVTLHVYQGEMTRCTTFEPLEGEVEGFPWEGREALYRSRERILGYDD